MVDPEKLLGELVENDRSNRMARLKLAIIPYSPTGLTLYSTCSFKVVNTGLAQAGLCQIIFLSFELYGSPNAFLFLMHVRWKHWLCLILHIFSSFVFKFLVFVLYCLFCFDSNGNWARTPAFRAINVSLSPWVNPAHNGFSKIQVVAYLAHLTYGSSWFNPSWARLTHWVGDF